MTSLHYLRKYFDRLEQDFHVKYVEVIHDYHPESVHDLRVVIKKLNAFSDFLTYLNVDYKPRKFQRTLEKIHKKAGVVRNLGVEKKLIREDLAEDQVHSKLQKKLTKLHKKVEADFRDFEFKLSLTAIRYDMEEVKKYIRQLHVKGLYKNIHAYFVLLINRISDRVAGDQSSYHDIRKDLKELLYNLVFLDSFPDSYTIEKKVLDEIKQMADALDQWSDIYYTVNKMLVNKKLEKPLRKAIKADLDSATKQIEKSLAEFPASAKRLKKQLKPLVKSIGAADKKNINISYAQANLGDFLH